MASVCMPQANYQQQHFNMMLLQHQQNQQHHQEQTTQYHQTKHQHRIAPAPAPAPAKVLGNSNLQNIQTHPGSTNYGPMLVQKKKYTYANMPYGEQLPSVARRNARERNRVKQVNNGFANLRQHLPQTVINALSNGGRGASKKLSKVDTLRIAVEYIRGLQDLLDDTQSSGPSNVNVHLLDDCSNDGSHYSNSSLLGSQENNGKQNNPAHLMHSYHSEASASPTPSYCDSDISIGNAAQYMQPLKLEAEQFKFDAFDSYDDQPDDEELLDYISSWQEQ